METKDVATTTEKTPAVFEESKKKLKRFSANENYNFPPRHLNVKKTEYVIVEQCIQIQKYPSDVKSVLHEVCF